MSTGALPQPAERSERGARANRERHYADPIDRAKYWCGAPRDPARPLGPLSRQRCTCVVCEDIWRTYGTRGWLSGKRPAK